MMGKKFVIGNPSPYYLHPLEGSGVLITAVIFDGKNYDIWERAVRTALKSKNRLGFIDRALMKLTPKEGEDTSELQAREMVNSMVCSWILMSSSPS